MQPPRVRWIAADSRGPAQRRPRPTAVVGLSFEVCLSAAQLVSECCRGGGACAACVFPLRLGRKPKFPFVCERAGSVAPRQFAAERFCFRKVDIPYRQVNSGWQLCRERSGQVAHNPLPLPLRRLVLRHPETTCQRDLDLIFPGSALGFVTRASHHESSGRTPAQPDGIDVARVADTAAAKRHLGRCKTRRRHRGRHTADNQAAPGK